jgi:hypothetical protein
MFVLYTYLSKQEKVSHRTTLTGVPPSELLNQMSNLHEIFSEHMPLDDTPTPSFLFS